MQGLPVKAREMPLPSVTVLNSAYSSLLPHMLISEMFCPTGLKLTSPWKLEKDREGDASLEGRWLGRQDRWHSTWKSQALAHGTHHFRTVL